MEIERSIYLKRLIDRKHNGLVKVITGIRRSGKSYLLFKLFYAHLLSEGIDEEHIVRISFDDPLYEKYKTPEPLCDYLDSRIKDRNMYYLLLDEVQLLTSFEGVLNRYIRFENVDIYVTGSNSRFLSTDIITEFRGRGDEVHIMPLSFSEYYPAYKGAFNQAWNDYMVYGGLPNILKLNSDEQKESYLKNLFKELYILDIIERNGIKHARELGEIVDVLASTSSSLVNPRRLENTFSSIYGRSISEVTISKYIEHLEEAFIIKKAIRYDVKGRKYIGTPSKYYFEDVGLMNARLAFRQVEDSPHIMENIIFNELRFRGYLVDIGAVDIRDHDNKRVHTEVDFIANRGSQRYYIQSAYSLPSIEKINQERRPLLAIKDSFKKILVTADPIKTRRDENGITTISIEEFLTNPNSLEI